MASRSLSLLLAGAVLFTTVAPATGDDCRVIDDFSTARIGAFPPDWKPRKDAGREVYSVREQDGKRFLHAASRSLGIQAAKEYAWDLAAYPILAWSWRPIEFPSGADERKSGTNDSAVSVYAVFPHNAWSVRSLKYIWSAVAPVGVHLTSSQGLTQVRVLRSGRESKGEWVEEQVNVAQDYKRYFGDGELPKPAGIAVLTDSDDTKSSAQGDYANFRVCAGR